MHGAGAVHGHGPWQRATSPWQKKPPSTQDDGLALQRSVACPTVTSAWSVAAAGPLITKMAILGVRFAFHSFVDRFIHENGNYGVVVIACRRARHSAACAEAICALQRVQSLLPLEGTPRGLGASPRF